MNRYPKLGCPAILCAANLFSVIVSGCALKWVEKSATFSRGMFPALLVCGILGMLSFAMPDGSLFKPAFWDLIITLQLNIIPALVIKDSCKLANVSSDMFLNGVLILAVITTFAQWRNIKYNKIVSGISVIYTTAFFLVLFFVVSDSYWIFGFAALIIFNEFVLSRLITKYEMTTLEFRSIALCFYGIFAMNAVNDAAADIR